MRCSGVGKRRFERHFQDLVGDPTPVTVVRNGVRQQMPLGDVAAQDAIPDLVRNGVSELDAVLASGAAFAELALSVNPVADAALTANDVAESSSHGEAAVAIMFFAVPADRVAKVSRALLRLRTPAGDFLEILRRGGVIEFRGGFPHKVKIRETNVQLQVRAGSDAVRLRQSPGFPTMVIGTAQETGPGHAAAVDELANALADTGQFQYVTMNRQWDTTVTGLRGIPNATRRPDLIAVGRDGRIHAFEIASPGDLGGNGPGLEGLVDRLDDVARQIPSEYRGEVFSSDPNVNGWLEDLISFFE